LNAHYEPVPFVLPGSPDADQWEVMVDTKETTGRLRQLLLGGGKKYALEARSLALLRLRKKGRRAEKEDPHS
jgi:isoamylase